ncbi:MAG: hypothetical protein IT258_16505, partial [Saprospiraceae bacterium]|nr:hypothetical protein [Saprospiraceae bacterium]
MMQGDLIHLRYPVLFTVNIIHHYFLDKWVEINSVNEYKAFDELNDKDRASVLGNYNVESFFEIKPTNSTKLILDGNGLLFKPHALGFSVIGRSPGGASAQVAALDGSVRLQFWVRIIDPLFLKYSSGFAPIHAVEIEKATVLGEQDKLFKKVFFFTNEIGEATGHEFPQLANPAPPINGATSLELEPIVWKDNALQQAKKVLTSANINNDDTWKKIYDTRYVTSEDLRRIELSNELPNDLFALIEIQEGDA